VRIRIIFLKACFAAMLLAGESLADGPHAIAVSATVKQVCRIIAVPSFGSRASGAETDETASASGNTRFRCTKGSTFHVVSEDSPRNPEMDGLNNLDRVPDTIGARCSNGYACARRQRVKVASGTGLGLGEGNNVAFGIIELASLADYADTAGGTIMLTVNP
jgi:hypothetical protein